MRSVLLKTKLKYTEKVGVAASWLLICLCEANIIVDVIIEMCKCITSKIIS